MYFIKQITFQALLSHTIPMSFKKFLKSWNQTTNIWDPHPLRYYVTRSLVILITTILCYLLLCRKSSVSSSLSC